MDTYTKLFRSLATSTICSESLSTRWLWIVMLSQCDKAGCVYGSIPGLARLSNISIQECEAALQSLMAPDPYSRTPDNEGRRLESIDGGWRLLNHAKYDAMRGEVERRERKREWDRANRPSGWQRGKPKEAESDQSDDSPTVRQKSAEVRRSGPTNTNTNTSQSNSNSSSPETSLQAEKSLVLDTPRASACESPPAVAGTDAGAACKAMRAAGLPSTSPAHPELLALIAAGATTVQFAQAAAVAVGKGKGFAYALGVLRGQMADAAAPPKPARGDPEAIHVRNRHVASEWLAEQAAGDSP